MINTEEIHYLTTEDFVKQMAELCSAMRDLANDMEIFVNLFVNERYMTATEVSDMLKCSVQQIPREIPCNHIGRNYLYHLSDVQKWLNSTKSRRS